MWNEYFAESHRCADNRSDCGDHYSGDLFNHFGGKGEGNASQGR